jgi:hypothetical protein
VAAGRLDVCAIPVVHLEAPLISLRICERKYIVGPNVLMEDALGWGSTVNEFHCLSQSAELRKEPLLIEMKRPWTLRICSQESAQGTISAFANKVRASLELRSAINIRNVRMHRSSTTLIQLCQHFGLLLSLIMVVNPLQGEFDRLAEVVTIRVDCSAEHFRSAPYSQKRCTHRSRDQNGLTALYSQRELPSLELSWFEEILVAHELSSLVG